MCVDFVGRVIGRSGDLAEVEIGTRRVRASTLLMPQVSEGDWVRVALGTILELVDADEAQAINAELRAAQGAAPEC